MYQPTMAQQPIAFQLVIAIPVVYYPAIVYSPHIYMSDAELLARLGHGNYLRSCPFDISSFAPHIWDVRQGSLGDCAFLGCLISILSHPMGCTFIRNMFNYHETKLCVRLFYPKAGNQFDEYYIYMDRTIFTHADHHLLHKSALWVHFLQKAYVILMLQMQDGKVKNELGNIKNFSGIVSGIVPEKIYEFIFGETAEVLHVTRSGEYAPQVNTKFKNLYKLLAGAHDPAFTFEIYSRIIKYEDSRKLVGIAEFTQFINCHQAELQAIVMTHSLPKILEWLNTLNNFLKKLTVTTIPDSYIVRDWYAYNLEVLSNVHPKRGTGNYLTTEMNFF
jgi:hypothetical protein